MEVKLVGMRPASVYERRARQQQQQLFQQSQRSQQQQRACHHMLSAMAHRSGRTRGARAHAEREVDTAGAVMTQVWSTPWQQGAQSSGTVGGAAQLTKTADPERPRNAERLMRTRPGDQAAATERVMTGMGYIDKVGNLGNMCYAVPTVISVGLKGYTGLQEVNVGHWMMRFDGLKRLLCRMSMAWASINMVEGTPWG